MRDMREVMERLLADTGIKGAARAWFVPGRIEVLGKHTDYAGGSSIVVAVEKGFCLVAAARDDGNVNIIDAATGETSRFVIDPDITPAHGHWSNSPMTVVRRLARTFTEMSRGADIAFMSDLPPASGMSSSSAMIVAFSLAMISINELDQKDDYRSNITGPESLAGYLATVENGRTFGTLAGASGVGTFGGSEDHTAILCCRPGNLSQYAYCPVRFERSIRVPDGYVFAVGASGIAAEKTGEAQEKYNRASHLASAVSEAWRKTTGRDDPHMAAAIASSKDAANSMREILVRIDRGPFTSSKLINRFEHFFAENEEIIPAAGDALADGDLEGFGVLVDRSQDLTEKLLGNQIPETVFLARSAREEGAAAASAFGAGFGGSVWTLVKKENAEEFLENWAQRYGKQFPAASVNASFFLTPAGSAAFEI